MAKLLRVTTYGMKSLEKPIVIDFANKTYASGFKKINTVKGIYGYNGSGKSAIIEAVDFYKRLCIEPDFLRLKDNQRRLRNLVNFKKEEFYISLIFTYDEKNVIKHEILLRKDRASGHYYFEKESISLAKNKNLDGEYSPIVSKEGEKIDAVSLGDSELSRRLEASDYKFESISSCLIREIILRQIKKESESKAELVLVESVAFALTLEVYLLESDKHRKLALNKESLESLSKILSKIGDDSYQELNEGEDIVPQSQMEEYEKQTKGLERFVQYFKPSIKELRLTKIEDRGKFHVRKTFVYEDYNVDLEYESSGIKALVSLYPCLKKCAKGAIAFVDEIDTNINSVYLEKMLSFFRKYGEGQLIFTAHNLETMKAIKSQPRAIAVLGEDGELDTWVAQGNRSPSNEYQDGYFPNSPMNVEDFDYISIFQGE